MTIRESSVFSSLVTAGLVVAVVDSAGGGPGAVQVVVADNHSDTKRGMYILVRHPNLIQLENANARIRTSREWVDTLSSLILPGRTLETTEILLDRVPV